jgi:hypothetical protein
VHLLSNNNIADGKGRAEAYSHSALNRECDGSGTASIISAGRSAPGVNGEVAR